LHTHLAGAFPQPHAHTTSYARYLQAQPMLAAPRSPVLVPTPGAASPCASYSPSRTHSLSPMRLCSPSQSCTPPHLQRQAAALHPASHTDIRPHARPDAHLLCAQMHASAKKQKRTSRLLKPAKHTRALQSGVAGGERGTGQSKCAEEAAPRIRLSPLLGSKRPRRRSRIGSDSNAETAG